MSDVNNNSMGPVIPVDDKSKQVSAVKEEENIRVLSLFCLFCLLGIPRY